MARKTTPKAATKPARKAKPGKPKPWSPAEVEEAFRRFKKASPAPTTELQSVNPYTLLVAVVLSAQATDAGVNKATPALFAAADTPEKMVALGEDRVRDLIKTIGLYRNKAKNVVELSRRLVAEHGGKVPRNREALQALPGVGRKTANVVLNVAFGEKTIAVDTHIFRVGNRTNMAPGPTPFEVELNLGKVVPDEYKLHAHHWLILHGRYTCIARKPLCETCIINDLCRWPEKTVSAPPRSGEAVTSTAHDKDRPNTLPTVPSSAGRQIVSQWDVKGLETNFEGFRKDRYPDLPTSEAFERFAIRQILKDGDLSDDEIESGIFAGGDDGGVDGMYFFVNRILVQDETDLPDEALQAELVIVQAKLEAGFSEVAITKLEAFCHDLLDHNRDVDAMVHLNASAREAIRRFRDNYTKILASPHTMTVTFAYANKSDQEPHTKVGVRVASLKQYVQQQLSDAKVAVEFWGAQRLLTVARRTPKTTETLDISKQFTADDGSAVCLVKLGSLATLLRGEHGDVRRSMLEPNVRDYQGAKNVVNKAIRQSLAEKTAPEFWWLNNGVTILATKCSVVGNKIVIEKPEVVNGLQTSYEIFQFFKSQPDKVDTRNVLVRVIVPPDEQIRSNIIRATNSQTPINEVSLRATDPIHFDIEEKFRLYGLFYERRKGEYRELKKPVDQIISIQTLARAVIALLLQQPNNAYATPSRVLKSDYEKVFNENHSRDMFVVCMLIQRQVDKYLANRGDELKDVRSIIRYYVSMATACHLMKAAAAPTDKELAALLPIVLKPLDSTMLDESVKLVQSSYKKHGGTETIAKGPDMRETILKELKATFSPPGELGL